MRVVVIGLDGAHWDILKPRMAAGQMPNLKRLAEAGAMGDLRSIYPPETPAAWPSFMTGKNPGKHGVFDFLVYQPDTQTHVPVNAHAWHGKAFWEYLSAAGKTSLVLNVPTTYPPRPIQGAMISGFLTPAGAKDFAYPNELVDELEADFGPYPLFFESMAFVSAGSEYNATRFLDELELMDKTKFQVAEQLSERFQPDFTMLHIWGTDRVQHELWSWMDPDHPRYDPRMAERFGPRIDAYYAMIDEHIGRLAEQAGPDAAVFVISDHGFGATHHFIDLNSWLLREGFITLKDSFGVRFKRFLWDLGVTPHNATRLLAPILKLAGRFKAASPEAAIRKSTGAINIPGMLNLNDVDWTRTRAFAPFGWSGIFINTQGIRPNGCVAPEDYEAVRDEMVARWKELVNPMTGEPVGGPVTTNAEMFHGPYAKYGPDVMPLPLAEKYLPVCFFGFTSKEPVYENNTLFGNHRMEGVLAAKGPGIRTGTVDDANLIDIGPTVLHLLDQPVPDDMDGRVLTHLLDPQYLAEHPVASCHVDAGDGDDASGLSEEEQEEIRKKLMGLGYL